MRAEHRLLSFCCSRGTVKDVFSIVDDEQRYRKIARLFRVAKNKPIHVIFSVPEMVYHWDITRLRPLLYKLAKKCGLYGGCAIFHPFRENEATARWYFSPHFHVIGFGWIRFTRSIYEKTGWVIKNKGIRKTVHGTLLYQLSHAGIHPEHHVVTWWGRLSYNKLKVDPLPEIKPVCPLCGNSLVELIFIGSLDRPPPDEDGDYYLVAEDWKPLKKWAHWS